LQGIKARAERNGVNDLQLLSGAQARAMERELVCDAAIYSPGTGIVDSHALMLALQGDIEHAGGMVVLNSPLERADCTPAGICLSAADGHATAGKEGG